MRSALEALHAELTSDRLRRDLARLVEAEERIYRAGARTSYFADALGVDVLTDTTERSPTFCTPSFKKWDDAEASESWAFLFTPEAGTEQAWTRLLRRAPQTIEWTQDDLRALLDDEAAERQGSILGDIRLRELLRFRIGLDGLADRPFRPGDGVTAVVSQPDLAPHRGRRRLRGAAWRRRADRGRHGSSLCRTAPDARSASRPPRRRPRSWWRSCPCPTHRFFSTRWCASESKMLLNALSTCTMVRLGRVLGNRMICLVPSNLKLIDRSTRYIRDLAGVSYEEACHALFEVIDFVEPRRRAGRAYPAPVGVATMHLRDGLDLPAAEARLYEELG